MYIKKFSLLFAFALLSSATFAQFSFSVGIGGTMPLSEWAKSGIDDNGLPYDYTFTDCDKTQGGAGLGFSAGVKFSYHLFDSISAVASIDYMRQSANNDLFDYYDDYEFRTGAIVSLPVQQNIPIMLGLHIYRPIGLSSFSLFAEGSAGISIHCFSDFQDVHYGYRYISSVRNIVELYDYRSYKTSTTFAFHFAAGVTYNQRFTLSLHYYSLGSATIYCTYSDGELLDGKALISNSGTYQNAPLSQSLLALRLDVSFLNKF